MKIGTIVKVVANSLEAPECTIGAYGVIMPMEVWWVPPTGNVAVLFCYNRDVSSDLQGKPWIFAEEDLQPASRLEDLPKGMFDQMNNSYIKLRWEHKNLFQGAPAELSFPSWEGYEEETAEEPVEDQLKVLLAEYERVDVFFNGYLEQAEESLGKAAEMRIKFEAMVSKLKELQRRIK